MFEPTANTALVANGSLEDSEWLVSCLRKHEHVVAVDGGLTHCLNAGIDPEVIFGDLDSIDHKLLDRCSKAGVIQYCRDKDATDLELAVKELMPERERLVVYGALGGRTDHWLANLLLLCRYPQQLFFESPSERLVAVGRSLKMRCYEGQVISLMPIGQVQGVNSQGLRWELENAHFSTDLFSLSNESMADEVTVQSEQGNLICCLSYRAQSIS